MQIVSTDGNDALQLLLSGAHNATCYPNTQINEQSEAPESYTTIGAISYEAAVLYNLLQTHIRVTQVNSNSLHHAKTVAETNALEKQRRLLTANVEGLRKALKAVVMIDFDLPFDCEMEFIANWQVAIPTIIYIRLPQSEGKISKTG